jgi:hypothetical protein
MKLPKIEDEAFLRLARGEDNCSISAGSMRGVFQKKESPTKGRPARGAMTLNVTVPNAVYRQVAELAERHRVSVERIIAAALAEQLSGWARVERMADRGSLERFLAALEKVPAAEPAPEDRQ